MHIDEVAKRASNARLAGLGAAGICVLNCYRVSQEVGYVSDSVKILFSSGVFGLMSGLVWFFMPRAHTDQSSDTAQQTKSVLKEPIQVMLKRVIAEHRESVNDMKRTYSGTNSGSRNYSYPASSSTYSRSGTTTQSSTVVSTSTTAVVVRRFQDPWEKPFSKVPLPIEDDEDISDIPDDEEDDRDALLRKFMEESLLDDEMDEYESFLKDADEDDE